MSDNFTVGKWQSLSFIYLCTSDNKLWMLFLYSLHPMLTSLFIFSMLITLLMLYCAPNLCFSKYARVIIHCIVDWSLSLISFYFWFLQAVIIFFLTKYRWIFNAVSLQWLFAEMPLSGYLVNVSDFVNEMAVNLSIPVNATYAVLSSRLNISEVHSNNRILALSYSDKNAFACSTWNWYWYDWRQSFSLRIVKVKFRHKVISFYSLPAYCCFFSWDKVPCFAWL